MENLIKDKLFRWGFVALLFALVVFLLSQALLSYRQYQFTGIGVSASNTISVSGRGKVLAKPDMASFSVTVKESSKEQKQAQEKATKKINQIINFLREKEVEEKDVRTSAFNLSPRYDWIDGKRKFREYEASQTLTVKIRDIEKAGEILSAMSAFGAEHVGSLRFEIENPDKFKEEARQKAIAEAKKKAQDLADALGVELVRVVGFSEQSDGYRPPVYFAKALRAEVSELAVAEAPKIPEGENEVAASVTIKYEIR